MHLDVLDLRNFYYRSPLGRAAQKVIRDELLQIWPEAKGQTVAGGLVLRCRFCVPICQMHGALSG